MVALLARAFSSGCAALTGVEAISNGVPAFKKPKSRNAATTLLLLGSISVTMLIGVILLANVTGLKLVDRGSHALLAERRAGRTYVRRPPSASRPARCSTTSRPASTSSIGGHDASSCSWPRTPRSTASRCSARSWPRTATCPGSCYTRGDRLAFSNGIVILAALAIVLIVAFNAEVTALIQLYIVGVFVSFTISQTGMMRHWTRHLKTETEPRRARGR